MGVMFYLIGCYFLYTVASFHNLLRRMNKNSSMIVASVSQGKVQLLYIDRLKLILKILKFPIPNQVLCLLALDSQDQGMCCLSVN
jgi:hypothetical protein